MSNLTDRELCRRVELACTPQAKPPKPWPEVRRTSSLTWTDIAVIAALAIAYTAAAVLHGAPLGAL